MSELRKPTEGDRTLRPGFIDTHSHFQLLDRLDPIQGAERQRRQLLAAREAGIDAMLLAPGALRIGRRRSASPACMALGIFSAFIRFTYLR